MTTIFLYLRMALRCEVILLLQLAFPAVSNKLLKQGPTYQLLLLFNLSVSEIHCLYPFKTHLLLLTSIRQYITSLKRQNIIKINYIHNIFYKVCISMCEALPLQNKIFYLCLLRFLEPYNDN